MPCTRSVRITDPRRPRRGTSRGRLRRSRRQSSSCWEEAEARERAGRADRGARARPLRRSPAPASSITGTPSREPSATSPSRSTACPNRSDRRGVGPGSSAARWRRLDVRRRRSDGSGTPSAKVDTAPSDERGHEAAERRRERAPGRGHRFLRSGPAAGSARPGGRRARSQAGTHGADYHHRGHRKNKLRSGVTSGYGRSVKATHGDSEVADFAIGSG